MTEVYVCMCAVCTCLMHVATCKSTCAAAWWAAALAACVAVCAFLVFRVLTSDVVTTQLGYWVHGYFWVEHCVHHMAMPSTRTARVAVTHEKNN